MLKKSYRLRENEIGKVFKGKPFFSYGFVANVKTNNFFSPRFAIVLSSKHTKNSVERNFFRRMFYDIAKNFLDLGNIDILFVPKKGSIFSKKSEENVEKFKNDINFLLRKIKEQYKNNF
ncbi:MAG: ribonuclease P protein component [Candidatus Gracilibacteria bacterium]|nr:ribonuclease P protein component [Candidatus Gracilibacteria bacterium]MDD4530193.1 ribonuclease P protein component [Candidatus Gracilibacteria bacterium]